MKNMKTTIMRLEREEKEGGKAMQAARCAYDLRSDEMNVLYDLTAQNPAQAMDLIFKIGFSRGTKCAYRQITKKAKKSYDQSNYKELMRQFDTEYQDRDEYDEGPGLKVAALIMLLKDHNVNIEDVPEGALDIIIDMYKIGFMEGRQ